MSFVPQRSTERDDVQPKLSMGQDPPAFFFRSAGVPEVLAGRIVTATDREQELADTIKRRNGPYSSIGYPQRPTTTDTDGTLRLETLVSRRSRAWLFSHHTLAFVSSCTIQQVNQGDREVERPNDLHLPSLVIVMLRWAGETA